MNTMALSKLSLAPAMGSWISIAALLGSMGGAWLLAPDGGSVSAILGTFAQIAGTMLGFLITALSILTAMINVKLLANMKRTGHYETLVDRLIFTSVAFLATMLVSLASMLLAGDWARYGLSVACGLMAFSSVWLILTGRNFHNVILTVNQ